MKEIDSRTMHTSGSQKPLLTGTAIAAGKRRRLLLTVAAGLLLAVGGGLLQAGTLYVPNRSFELPGAPAEPPYAAPDVDAWQKAPAPAWYNPATNDFAPWEYLSGTFTNVPFPGQAIDNCHGVNAGYMFALPENTLFQDFNTVSGTNPTPTHAFNAKFSVGHAYDLTVAVLGNGPGMKEGVTLQLSLYYRDNASNIVTVASTTVTNTTNNFPNHTHFVDFSATIPVVNTSDPWAGKNIGIQLLSTAQTNNTGGYWDFDNVRVVETVAPALANPAKTNGQFHLTLLSEPELAFDILATPNVTTVSSNWTVLGTLTNVTGAGGFADSQTNHTQRFYRARRL